MARLFVGFHPTQEFEPSNGAADKADLGLPRRRASTSAPVRPRPLRRCSLDLRHFHRVAGRQVFQKVNDVQQVVCALYQRRSSSAGLLEMREITRSLGYAWSCPMLLENPRKGEKVFEHIASPC